MVTVEVTTVGSSEAANLPKEAQDLLGVQTGDRLHLARAPDGALRITPYDPEFKRQMQLAELLRASERSWRWGSGSATGSSRNSAQSPLGNM